RRVSLGHIRRQHHRIVRAGAALHAADGTHERRPVAALRADDRLPGGLYDLLHALARDLPTPLRRCPRARACELARQPRRGSRGRLPRRGDGTPAVKIEGEGKLLRIFVGESDTWHGKPLYQAIVERVRAEGLAGATVIRGIEGFGADSRIHTSRILRLSEDLPVLIEIADTTYRIDHVLPLLDEMFTEGLVTLERVEIIAYRSSS